MAVSAMLVTRCLGLLPKSALAFALRRRHGRDARDTMGIAIEQ
jgi:hypothetical protein